MTDQSDHYQKIYRERAHDYERLIAREDFRGNILKALKDIVDMRDIDVVEMGAGTGRLTRLVVRYAKRVAAFDQSHHMLSVAYPILSTMHNARAAWLLATADSRQLPVADNSADLVLEGWSLGHFCEWYPSSWQDEVEKAFHEMQRVARPGATLLLMETLGTGFPSPRPPAPRLADFYDLLEQSWGFQREIIRTDYRFRTPFEAEELTRFFFGDHIARLARQNKSNILREWTGIWHRTIPA